MAFGRDQGVEGVKEIEVAAQHQRFSSEAPARNDGVQVTVEAWTFEAFELAAMARIQAADLLCDAELFIR